VPTHIVTDVEIDAMRAQEAWERRYLEEMPTTPEEALLKISVWAPTERRHATRAVLLESIRLLAGEHYRAKFADIFTDTEAAS